MSGIIALLSKNKPISESALKQGIKSLEHRGPDKQSFWISPHRQVGLGHTRLSIIDLTGGDQPIANFEETLHIVTFLCFCTIVCRINILVGVQALALPN
jgi:asparagine synthase (glutamine-hydrolysing)